ARQIIAGEEPLVNRCGKKPLSVAGDELYKSKIRITGDDEEDVE
ncbi:MAG: DNA-directed RNA polymerase subunit omega, partial [Lachnospiraceae bacterium]|nr:DNA-directed RNA polymerase subunit omega [Lachnospiraceae bacterium]